VGARGRTRRPAFEACITVAVYEAHGNFESGEKRTMFPRCLAVRASAASLSTVYHLFRSVADWV